MKTIYDFINTGTLEQKYTAMKINRLAQEEKSIERVIDICRQDDEKQHILVDSKNVLEKIRKEMSTLLTFAKMIGMEDSDFVALNYKQYTGESIIIER